MKHTFTLVFALLLFASETNAQWTEVPLPTHSVENDILQTDNYWFTHMSPGGVFRSNDNGQTWEKAIKGLPRTREFRSLIIFKNKLLVSTFNEGVYVSSDFGDNWSLASNLPKGAYDDFEVIGDKLYVIERNGNISSTDIDAVDWLDVVKPSGWTANGVNRSLFSNSQGELFALAEGIMSKYSVSSESWEGVSSSYFPQGLSYAEDIEVRDNTIWISTRDGSSQPILLYSLDDGTTWNRHSINSNYLAQSLESTDSFIAYMAGGVIYYSEDNGSFWKQKTLLFSSELVGEIDGEFIYSSKTSTNKFNPSTDISSPYPTTGISGYTINNLEQSEDKLFVRSDIYVDGGIVDMFTLDKVTSELTAIPRTSDDDLYAPQDIAVVQNHLYGIFRNQYAEYQIYQFDSDNSIWIKKFDDIKNTGSLARGTNNLYFYIYTDPFTFYKAPVGSDTPIKLDIPSPTYNFTVFENDTITIITGENAIDISLDNGATFSETDPDVFAANYYSSTVTQNKIFAPSINGLFVSENNGEGWSEMENELIELPRDVKNINGRLFLTTANGLLSSPDEGVTWYLLDDGVLGSYLITDLIFDETHIYAATEGGGIWKSEISNLTVAPVISDFVGTTEINEDNSLEFALSDFDVEDSDNSFPSGFTLTILEGNNYTVDESVITPDENFNGTLTVKAIVNDGEQSSEVFEISITVNPVNDVPIIISAEDLTTAEETPLTINLTNLEVTDVDNNYPDDFSLSLVEGDNYTISNSQIQPIADFNGELVVSVKVNDGSDDSNVFGITVNVSPVNDAPVITGAASLTTPMETSLELALTDLTVTDPDNEYPNDFSLTVIDGDNYSLNGNQVTPETGFFGTLTIPVRVNDGTEDSNTFNLSMNVSPVASIDDNTKLANISSYPNPSEGILNVRFSNSDHHMVRIELFNLSGKLVLQADLPKNDFEFIEKITINELNNGIYLLKVTQSGITSESKKIVLNK